MSRSAAFWLGFTLGRFLARFVDALAELAERAGADDVAGDDRPPPSFRVDAAGTAEPAE